MYEEWIHFIPALKAMYMNVVKAISQSSMTSVVLSCPCALVRVMRGTPSIQACESVEFWDVSADA